MSAFIQEIKMFKSIHKTFLQQTSHFTRRNYSIKTSSLHANLIKKTVKYLKFCNTNRTEANGQISRPASILSRQDNKKFDVILVTHTYNIPPLLNVTPCLYLFPCYSKLFHKIRRDFDHKLNSNIVGEVQLKLNGKTYKHVANKKRNSMHTSLALLEKRDGTDLIFPFNTLHSNKYELLNRGNCKWVMIYRSTDDKAIPILYIHRSKACCNDIPQLSVGNRTGCNSKGSSLVRYSKLYSTIIHLHNIFKTRTFGFTNRFYATGNRKLLKPTVNKMSTIHRENSESMLQKEQTNTADHSSSECATDLVVLTESTGIKEYWEDAYCPLLKCISHSKQILHNIREIPIISRSYSAGLRCPSNINQGSNQQKSTNTSANSKSVMNNKVNTFCIMKHNSISNSKQNTNSPNSESTNVETTVSEVPESQNLSRSVRDYKNSLKNKDSLLTDTKSVAREDRFSKQAQVSFDNLSTDKSDSLQNANKKENVEGSHTMGNRESLYSHFIKNISNSNQMESNLTIDYTLSLQTKSNSNATSSHKPKKARDDWRLTQGSQYESHTQMDGPKANNTDPFYQANASPKQEAQFVNYFKDRFEKKP